MATTPVPPFAAPPDFPALSDRASGTYNSKAFAWAEAMQSTTGPNIHALAVTVKDNADDAAANTLLTDADRVQTGLDRVQTGADRNAAEASRIAASKLNLGNKASAPTLDNQGDALLAGTTYYDTTLNKWRVWTGVAWGDGISAIAGVSSLNGLTGDVSGIATDAGLEAKQATLVSGSNIKTLNGTSLLGSGNVTALTDAPSDGKTYGRKDGAWVEGGSGISLEVGDVFYTARTLTFPTWLPCDGAAYLQSSYTALFGELGVLANVDVGTKLANPATLPAGNGSGCSWDASGTYLAVGHNNSPYVTVYQRSGSTLTKLADPATLPPDTAYGCSWDGTGTYLAVGHNTSPYMTVYARSGTTLTKLADPATLPPDTAYCCSWDASGTYLAVSHTTSPFVTVYERSGTTLTKLANPATLPAGGGYGCSWDASGTYLAVGHFTSPYVTVYERSGTTLTKLANHATLPTGIGRSCSWDASGVHLAVAHDTTPFVTVYQNTSYDVTNQFAVPSLVAPAGVDAYIKALP